MLLAGGVQRRRSGRFDFRSPEVPRAFLCIERLAGRTGRTGAGRQLGDGVSCSAGAFPGSLRSVLPALMELLLPRPRELAGGDGHSLQLSVSGPGGGKSLWWLRPAAP